MNYVNEDVYEEEMALLKLLSFNYFTSHVVFRLSISIDLLIFFYNLLLNLN